MAKKTQLPKLIHGLDAEDYFGTVIGPMAASILEKCLYKFMQTEGTGMTGAELKLTQFAIERSYGAATRRMDVVRYTDAEIAADQLEGMDPAILRRIASTNARRDDSETIN